jgi:GTP-binding protein
MDFINDIGAAGIPMALIGTKSDKLGKDALLRSVKAIEDEMLKTWENLPPFIISSSEDKTGKEEIWNFIFEACKAFKPLS